MNKADQRRRAAIDASESHGYAYLAWEAGLLIVISYVLFLGSTHYGMVAPGVMAVTAGFLSAAAVVYVWLGRGVRKRIGLPLLACGAALLLSTVFSLDPRRSLSEVWLIAVPLVFFLLTIEIVRRGCPPELIVKCVLIAGAIFMALTWLEPLRWYLSYRAAFPEALFPGVTYRLPSPNFLAVMLNMFLLLALARLLFTRTRGARWVLGVYVLSTLTLLYLTSSRGGWLGTITGLSVIGLFGIYRQRNMVEHRLRSARKSLLAFGGISIAVFLAAAGWLFYRQTMHPSHGALLSSRDELWAPAWQGFVSSPLIGQGAHTYASLFLQTHSTPPARLFDYAHSIYLDVLSSSGLLGLAAFLWLIAGLGRIFLRRLREAEENDLPVVLGASAVLAGFLVHGLADSVHHTVPTCLWMLSIILGASLSPGEPTGKTAGLSKWSARALPLLVAAYAWFNLWQAMPLAQGVQAAQPGDYSRAAVLLRDAARRDPNLAVPHQQQGLVEAHLAAAGDPAALDRAIAAFERAAELDPYWGLNSANLGLLYLQAGDQDAAVRAFQQAIMAAPESGQYHLLAGAAYEASGHTDSAMEAYNQALDLQPRLHEAIFWQVTAQRRQVLAGWQSADSGESPTLARLEAALRSDPSDLRAYLPLISAHLNAGRLEEADRLASQAGFAYSIRAEDRLTLLNLRADLADAQHDGQTAAILRAQAELQFGEPGLYGPGDMVQSWYAQWSYRRMALNLDWVPQAKSYVE